MNFYHLLLSIFAVYASQSTGGAKDFANKLLTIVATVEQAKTLPPA